ncbi:MAG TPA: hypothetical protein VFS39_14840 [Nitrospira sp.]|nr:hypothetical protein [Nitrospira sp.]
MQTESATPGVDEQRRIELPNGDSVSEDGNNVPARKVRLTVNLPKELVEQMRDAVYWTPGLTLAWLIARAMQHSLAEMHSSNQGPFPKRSRPLRAGRPRLTGQAMALKTR